MNAKYQRGAAINRQHPYVEVLFSDITESGEALDLAAWTPPCRRNLSGWVEPDRPSETLTVSGRIGQHVRHSEPKSPHWQPRAHAVVEWVDYVSYSTFETCRPDLTMSVFEGIVLQKPFYRGGQDFAGCRCGFRAKI